MPMNSTIKEDVLHILSGILEAISHKNIDALADLSNQTIHNASIFQDKDSINIAIITYALHKIILRNNGFVHPKAIRLIEDAKHCFETGTSETCKNNMGKLLEYIAKVDRKLGLYIRHVINEAQIRKGSKVYDHGISLARAAEIMGISRWELMKYVGNTATIDGETGTPLRQRIAIARELFGE